MARVVVSAKYQVVIPKEVRSKVKLKPGQKVVVLEKDGIVQVIPVKPMKQMKGFAKGVDTEGIRDEHDRL